MLNDNAHSTGSSSSRDNDGYGEENRHTAEQLLTVTRSSRTAILYKQADYLYIPYGMLHSYILSLMTWYLILTKLQTQDLSDL